MTKEEFIDRHYYELLGFITDAMMQGRSGAIGALWLRSAMTALRHRLGTIYQEMQPTPINGRVPTKGAPS